MTQFGVRSSFTSEAAKRINAAGRLAQWEMHRQARERANKAAEDLERARMELQAAKDAERAAHLREQADFFIAQAAADKLDGIKPRVVPVRVIADLVCEHFDIKRNDLLSARRHKSLVRPRHVAMYLSKELTGKSYPEIGRRFGDRDHTTVIHGVRKIAALIAAGDLIAEDVAAIRSKLCLT